MKTYKSSRTFVRVCNAFEPVSEDLIIPSIMGWEGRSDEIRLKKGEYLEVVEHGDAENFSTFKIVSPPVEEKNEDDVKYGEWDYECSDCDPKEDYKINFPEGYVKPKLPWGKRWTEALRSGKYEQGSGRLVKHQKYCCLGVLCRLQGRLTDNGYDGEGDDATSLTLSKYNPVVVVQGFSKIGSFPDGVTVDLIKMPRGNGKRSLVDLNDSVVDCVNENGFKIVADVIEAVWECGDEEIPK